MILKSNPRLISESQRRSEANKRYRQRLAGEQVPFKNRPWSKEEIDKLRRVYLLYKGKKQSWLKSFSMRINRHPSLVCRKARELGFGTDQFRTIPFELRKPPSLPKPKEPTAFQLLSNDEQTRHRSLLRKKWHRENEHPKGMLGKKHSPEVCLKISKGHMGHSGYEWTQEQRRAMSQLMVNRLKQQPESIQSHNRGKGGKREDLNGRYFRSSWEANYARYLNFINVQWQYETQTFWFEKIKRGSRSYTPDFYLPETKEFHEVKGWMDQKSKTKLKRMAKYFPDTKIVLIDKRWFASANKKGLCRIIPGWECKHAGHNVIKAKS